MDKQYRNDITALHGELFALADEKYAAFQARLVPNIDSKSIIGVRVPELRRLVREMSGTERERLLSELRHAYYEENIIHSIILSGIKDYKQCLTGVEAFLPQIDNWAVCDTLRPRVFARHTSELLESACAWSASRQVYTCRFGVGVLMTYYLDGSFSPELLEIPARIESEDYYVRMAVAWYYATALAKQYDAALPYIEQRRLPRWTHRKTIQKATESYRITADKKDYLRSLK